MNNKEKKKVIKTSGGLSKYRAKNKLDKILGLAVIILTLGTFILFIFL